jgi:acyl-homoserine-lactone acylase
MGVAGFGACASTNAADALQANGSANNGASSRSYEAKIRRTSFGIPHIVAADVGSLGFGEGYAQAEDHLCTIADQVVRGRGERAKYFGRGEGDRHLLSDIAAKAIVARESADSSRSGPPREFIDLLDGFAAGYNLYLERTGKDALPRWCRGQDWVFRVTPADLRAAIIPALSAAQIARARPPGAPGGGAIEASLDDEPFDAPLGASQGWALGREITESGRGALLANPHFPWGGSSRFWEKHLTIPGELDVYGVNLIGAPGVGIGFNDKVAWTFTTTSATQFTIYRLRLVPGRPTRYRYGSEERDMVPVNVSVAVRGETEPVRQTVWFTHYGPVLVTPALAWTPEYAYAVRWGGSRSAGGPQQVEAMGRARSLAALKSAAAQLRNFSLNMLAVSAEGQAWYTAPSAIPNLSPDAIAAWLERRNTDPAVRAAWQNSRIVLLDGSDPAFEWVDGPHAGSATRPAGAGVPQLERSDFVFNANNSYWLAHPRALLTGDYSPLFGDQRTELTLRARSNVLHLTNASPYRAAGADGKFNLREIQDAVLDNRSLAADLLLPELLERCTATTSAVIGGRSVDLSRACAILGHWDRRFDLESRGAVLFREWLGQYDNREFASTNPAAPRRDGAGTLFAVAHDPADPINTPRGLAPGSLALENLAKAASLLDARGIALDVPLRELQYAPTKLPRRIAVHGGHGDREGVLNMEEPLLGNFTTLEPLQLAPRVNGSRFLTEAGYPVLHGSSFLMALEYTRDGPRAMALLTYSESGNPDSPHFIDQTERFARKEWRPILFRAADVAADVKREYTVNATSPQGGRRLGSRAP